VRDVAMDARKPHVGVANRLVDPGNVAEVMIA
jgi:hypothetical protein